MKILSKHILILLFPFLFIACKEEIKEKQNPIKPAVTLIEFVDNELNISYQVPTNWDKMPTSLTDKMVGRVRKHGEDEFIIYSPKSFYYNNANSSLLRVGKIKFKKNISSDSLSIETYIKMFQKYNRDLKIKISKITNSNFTIKKMEITKNNLISFKYLFRNTNNEILQFDFSIKEEQITNLKPSIDASVNSIKLL